MGEFEDLVKEIVDQTNADVERFMQEGMTKSEAEKMVVWGNKWGKTREEMAEMEQK